MKKLPKKSGIKATGSAQRMARHRARMRAKGYRLAQTWVVDTRKPGFQDEINRQLALLKDKPEERETLQFMERAFDDTGWV